MDHILGSFSSISLSTSSSLKTPAISQGDLRILCVLMRIQLFHYCFSRAWKDQQRNYKINNIKIYVYLPKADFNRKKKSIGHSKAIIALARKIATII